MTIAYVGVAAKGALLIGAFLLVALVGTILMMTTPLWTRDAKESLRRGGPYASL